VIYGHKNVLLLRFIIKRLHAAALSKNNKNTEKSPFIDIFLRDCSCTKHLPVMSFLRRNPYRKLAKNFFLLWN